MPTDPIIRLVAGEIDFDGFVIPVGTVPAHASTHRHGGTDEVAQSVAAASKIVKADALGRIDTWVSNAAVGTSGKAAFSGANPVMNGAAAPGSAGLIADSGHVHPTDTSRAPDNQPAVRVYNSAAISLATSVLTFLTFDTERYDTDGIHSTVSNTGRLTVVTAGVYSIFANVEFAANAAGERALSITLNAGQTKIASDFRPAVAGAGVSTRVAVATQYKLAAGDYLELGAFQSSGGNLNVSPQANYSPEFGMTRIGVG